MQRPKPEVVWRRERKEEGREGEELGVRGILGRERKDGGIRRREGEIERR